MPYPLHGVQIRCLTERVTLLSRASPQIYAKLEVKFSPFESAKTILEGILLQCFLSLTSKLFSFFLSLEKNTVLLQQ